MSWPKDWATVPLDSLTAKPICYGVVQPGENVGDKEGVPFIRGGDFPNGVIEVNRLRRISPEISEAYKRTILEGGELLVSLVGYPGATAIVPDALRGANIARQAALIKLKANVSIHFAKYFLASPIGQKALLDKTIGSAQQVINIADLKKIVVPLPPLEEQKKIAEILSTWDRAIEQQQNLVNKAKNQLKGLRENIFLRSAISKNEITFDSVKLGALVEPVKTKNSVGCQRVLTASGEHGLIDQREYFNRKIAATNLDGYYYLRRGDFAYNRSFMKGYPVGAIKQLNQYDDGVVSTLYLCFRPNAEFDGTYARHLFESGVLNEELGSVVQMGARAHGLLNITQEDFYSISVPITEMRNQKALGQALDRVENFIVEAELLLKRYQMQKQGLMQKLLTGKVRVKV